MTTSDDIRAEILTNCRPLRRADTDWFRSQGVTVSRALVRPYRILHDRVVFKRGQRFEFERYAKEGAGAVAAYLIPIGDLSDPDSLIDIVAWQPRTGDLATWLGRVCMLGEEQAFRPHLREGLAVHADPLTWLRSDRHGVVIIRPTAARQILLEAGPLVTATVDEGIALQALLSKVELPTILVSRPEEIAA